MDEHLFQRSSCSTQADLHGQSRASLARAKIEHVICSEDKDEAVRYVYSSELPHNPDGADAMQMAKQKALKTCKEADAVIEKHAKILQAVGVNGTPSFLFNVDTKPNLIVGFNQQK